VKSVTWQLGGICLCKNAVTVNLCIRDLANDEAVREAYDEAVLGRFILVLILAAQALALAVVSFSFTAAAVFDLVTREVRFIFLNFDESLSVGEWRGCKGTK
jgi:hypothetical protein